MTVADWLPLLLVGIAFSVMGGLKVYGLTRGIEGGSDKPVAQRLCGS
jgi:hypothetical protein